uniref:Integrase catalytic domain-containing protein n=1 Tax=Tanacetum cinerariifolium TaxID=118510 RepID=A0A6L2KDX0_TANCI|nr:hypothetical protein [Tanacetum cinerariifolium]
MSTRSSVRNLFPPLDNPELTIRRRSCANPTLLNNFEMATKGNGDPPVPDLRTMEELCQPSLNGRGGPIAPIAFQETNFGLKNDMIQQVKNSCQFHGLLSDDANKHLDKFLHVTQSIKFDRFPRNSINTFEKMAKMFLGKYFPPSMVTKLINEITNFRQRPDESLFEAWERYKLSINRCPNHNMLPVTQIDTFYNGLTLRHRDIINAAAGGTFMKRRPEECYVLIENMTAHHNDWDTSAQRSESSSSITSFSDPEIIALKDEMAKITKNLMRPPLATQNVYAAGAYQVGNSYQPQGTLPGNTVTNPKEDFKGITTRSGTAYQGPIIPTTSSSLSKVVECKTEVAKDMVHPTNNGSTKDVQPLIVQTETSMLNSEPIVAPIIEHVVAPVIWPDHQNLLTNKDKLYELARTSLNEHCSVVLLKKLSEKLGDPGKFLIPCDFPGMDECLALADLGASINLMPLSVWNKLSLPELSPTCMTLKLLDRSISRPVRVAKDVFVKVGMFHFPADFVVIDFDADPRVPLILERSFLNTGRALIDVFKRELTLRVGKEAITFNLYQTSRYSANYNDMTANQIDVIDKAYEEYSQEVLGFSDVIASGNPTPYYDPIVSTSSPTLTLFGDGDFLFEEVDSFLALEDGNYLPQVRKELKIYEDKNDKSSIDEPLEVEHKDLPSHLEYAFLEGDDKLTIVMAKDLSDEEKTTIIKHQRRVNPKIHDVIKKEVLKLLDAGLIYLISDSPWVSLLHCVPKKSGFTVVENEESELILTRLVTRWREKSHFMVKEGIGLDHNISKNEIEVDKAKVDVIAKLTHPTTVKGIRSFLSHVGFYRRFIQDFSKIVRLMTRLLEKDTMFFFFIECVEAFQTLKRNVTEAPILIAPDWNLPFELMCDASDFAIGVSSGGVFTARKPLTFSKLATIDPPGDIMARTTPPKRERFRNEMRCLKIPSKFEKFSTFEASISWGRSRLHEGTNIYSWPFGTPRAIISNRGTHFCNDQFTKVMLKYGVTHHLTTAYHPQTSGQVEVSNCGLKRILERTVGENRASWSNKLDDALWAFQHKSYWALKHANFDLQTAGDHRKVQLNELNKLRDQAYENSLIYKEKTKRIHDSNIKDRVFNVGDRVLLFNSRQKIFSGKLKTRWDWVKLSDPKQALLGRHPMNSWILKTCAKGFVLQSSLPQLHLGIIYPNLID